MHVSGPSLPVHNKASASVLTLPRSPCVFCRRVNASTLTPLILTDHVSVLHSQADERFRKNIQGSPQTAPPTKQPPVPPRSEPFSNGGSSESVPPAMHRPMEPQVNPLSSIPPFSLSIYRSPYSRLSDSKALAPRVVHSSTHTDME